MRTPRRRAREFAVQALYQNQLRSEYTLTEVVRNIQESDAYIEVLNRKKPQVDEELFLELVQGVFANKDDYFTLLKVHSDREDHEVNPIENAILLLACHELKNMPATPYPVIINEAIEIAKVYGGTDGYKFINGILDKLAIELRPNELKK